MIIANSGKMLVTKEVGNAEVTIGVNRRPNGTKIDKRAGFLLALDEKEQTNRLLLIRLTAHGNGREQSSAADREIRLCKGHRTSAGWLQWPAHSAPNIN